MAASGMYSTSFNDDRNSVGRKNGRITEDMRSARLIKDDDDKSRNQR